MTDEGIGHDCSPTKYDFNHLHISEYFLTIFTGVPELIYILHISSLDQLAEVFERGDDPQAASVLLPAHPPDFSGRR